MIGQMGRFFSIEADPPARLHELAEFAEQPSTGERVKAGKGVIYWQVPRASTLDSTIGKTMGKKRCKSATTTRNLRTIEKVLRS